MKKILSIMLCLVMMVTCMSLSFAAQDSTIEDISEYPVIIVPGFTASTFYCIDENGNQKPVWGTDPLGQITGNSSSERAMAIAKEAAKFVATGDADGLAKELNEGFKRIFAEFACGPDGQPVVPAYNYVNTPEETNYKNLRENYPDGDYQSESGVADILAQYIGYENIFLFTDDFRIGAVELAGQLRDYIDDVLEYYNQGRDNKVDKVNIYALSHGGQVTGTYLTLYGEEGKVNNATLLYPALAGATIAYDTFGGGEDFAEKVLIDFIEHGMKLEEELDIILEAVRLGFIDELYEELVEECLDHIRYWGSFWDFIPLSCYEEYKANHLDPEKCQVLIEQSDFVHYEIMSPDGDYYYGKGFRKAEAAGTKIYIVAGYDIQGITGMKESSDTIIPVSSATGATVAPFGKRFADGYTQKVDTGFYQVSPSMTVDASTAYLPERTWFIEKGYHGMTLNDEYTKNLFVKLLLNGGEAYDVQSLEKEGFSQFHATTNPAHIIFAEFDKSKEGYLSAEDSGLIVSNISADSIVTVSAIGVKGADLDFEFFPFILKPGESKKVKIDGSVPDVSVRNIEIDVTYLTDKITPVGERTFDFTILGGKKAEFDSENPLVDADYPDYLTGTLAEMAAEKLGVKKVSSYIFNILAQIMRYFTKLTAFSK